MEEEFYEKPVDGPQARDFSPSSDIGGPDSSVGRAED